MADLSCARGLSHPPARSTGVADGASARCAPPPVRDGLLVPSSGGTASTQGDRDATFPHRAAAVRVLGRRLGEDHRPRPLPDWRHRAQQPARTEAEPDRGGRGRHGGQHVTPRPAQPVPSGILTSTPAATATPRNQTRTASSRDPARRSPPRTVAAGTPRLAPIRRCPAPSARAVNAAQIHSAAYALRKSTTARHLASRPRLQRGAAQKGHPVVVIQRDGQHVRGNRIAGTVQVFCGGLQRLFIEIASRTVFPSPVDEQWPGRLPPAPITTTTSPHVL